LSQAANTFWDDRLERVTAARERAVAKRRVRSRRLIDAVIIAIILAASATCVSVYSRARAELDSALAKHAAAGEKLSDLNLKVQKLERDVQQLRTDSRVIELFARQRFGFVREGDVVIKVAQNQPDLTKASHEGEISLANPIERQTAERQTSVGEMLFGGQRFGEKQTAERQTAVDEILRGGRQSGEKQTAARQTAAIE
jgi:cell division protein FtsB